MILIAPCISKRTGKKIPLDADTEELRNCLVWKGRQQQCQPLQQQQQQGQRRYLQCSKGCGIYGMIRQIYYAVRDEISISHIK